NAIHEGQRRGPATTPAPRADAGRAGAARARPGLRQPALVGLPRRRLRARRGARRRLARDCRGDVPRTPRRAAGRHDGLRAREGSGGVRDAGRRGATALQLPAGRVGSQYGARAGAGLAELRGLPAALTGKYRNAAKKIQKDLAQAGCTLGPLKELDAHADRLHALYLGVVANAAVRPVTCPPAFFPALAARLGEEFRCVVVRREHELAGFISVLKDGDTAVAYYIGFDRASGVGNTIYLALLHAVIGEAIALGCRRVSFGRTALEPKAGLGARPERTWLWARHRNPVMNALIRKLLAAVPHGEAPERSPFKTSASER